MKLIRPLLLSVAALGCAAASPAQGSIIVASNFGDPLRTAPTGAYQAQSFTTGPSDLSLSKISVIFTVPTGPLTVDVALYSNSGAQPGSLLVDLGSKVISTTVAQNDYTYSGAFTLVASTTYWAVAFDATDTNRWFSTNQSQTGGVGTLGGAATSNDGITWTAFRQALLIQVEGDVISTAVPEPATLASAALTGLAGLATALRRRRS